MELSYMVMKWEFAAALQARPIRKSSPQQIFCVSDSVGVRVLRFVRREIHREWDWDKYLARRSLRGAVSSWNSRDCNPSFWSVTATARPFSADRPEKHMSHRRIGRGRGM
jgi:hypothetical protein